MTQMEFEKRRLAQVRVCGAMSNDRTMKIIDLIDLLLEREPDVLIVVPGNFLKRIEQPSACIGRPLALPRMEESQA